MNDYIPDIFQKDIKLVNFDGGILTITTQELVSIEPRIGIASSTTGVQTIASHGYDFFSIKTANEEFDVPRSPENDKAILDYIFQNCEIRTRKRKA
jgi:hypothetical protein